LLNRDAYFVEVCGMTSFCASGEVTTTRSGSFVVQPHELVVRAVLTDTPRAPRAAPGRGNAMKLTAPGLTSLALILFASGAMGSAWANNPSPAQVTIPAGQKGGGGKTWACRR
jgi:hypothetical protein